MTKEMTVREAGAKGGKRTLAKHGPKFFAKIGKVGGKVKKKKK